MGWDRIDLNGTGLGAKGGWGVNGIVLEGMGQNEMRREGEEMKWSGIRYIEMSLYGKAWDEMEWSDMEWYEDGMKWNKI